MSDQKKESLDGVLEVTTAPKEQRLTVAFTRDLSETKGKIKKKAEQGPLRVTGNPLALKPSTQ